MTQRQSLTRWLGALGLILSLLGVVSRGAASAPTVQAGTRAQAEKSDTASQERFAEHLWADPRNGEGAFVQSRNDQFDGYPKLMGKLRFREGLVDYTPAVTMRFSKQFSVNEQSDQEHENRRLQREALAEYERRWAEADTIVANVERQLGRPFGDLSEDDYSWLMENLDLNVDDDLWAWSHLTGIPIVALNQMSTFFYCNVHLLEDLEAAAEMSLAEIVRLKRGYDPENGRPTLHTADGRALRLRALPTGTVRVAARTGPFSHDENYAEPRIVLEALAPYLVKLEAIPNRQYIVDGIRALPLLIVKAYRGKAIYLTTVRGRSYAVGMPISNSVYTGFVGMQAGFFLDRNTGPLTTHNFVHELGHVIDYTVIAGQYGRYLHPYQFPELRSTKTEKDRVFGRGDDKVPATAHGYVSRYARTNAQENFAEHFANYILKKEQFLQRAEGERSAGHPELMDKYRFLERFLDRTPVTTNRLSRAYLEWLGG